MLEASSESNVVSLTEEQKEFLRQCEEDFANRFTDSDPEYVKVRDREKVLPPIEDPWRPIQFRDRDSFRDRDRGRHRDYQNRDRDGWRNHYGRNNYHSNYRRRGNNNHHHSYRRDSPYQSNYYRN